ncbi:MAG: acyl-CoA dehydrogenase family protein [Acidobacteriota bacterium]|jgi:acyl-CoA dehydrogenase family member 9
MPIDAVRQEEQIRMAEELFFSGEKLPSFARALFFGVCDSHRVFPFPQVDPSERARVEEVVTKLRSFCDEHLDPDWIDRHATIPKEVIQGLGRLGVLGCTIPTEYDGLGLTQYGYCRLVEELASRCGSTALFVNAHQSIGLKALLLYGTPQQKDRFLRPLARGEMLAAFALTEPNAGSDAAGIETTAEFDPDHRVYHINGAKQWITNGGIAGMLTVMAKVQMEGQQRITAFIVTPDMPGFKVVDPALEKVGMRGTQTAKLAFEDLEVPPENILGEPGQGLKIALTCLDFGRTTFGAACTGTARQLYRLAVDHAVHRRQFQRPLASFGLVKEMIARMGALLYAMESGTYLTAGLLDRGEEDFMLETAMLKVFASEALWQIVYDAMQILGGRSLFCDRPYERIMRDTRLNMIGEGSNEVLRAFIGAGGIRDVGMQLKEVVEATRHPLARLGKILGFGRTSIHRIVTSPTIPVRSEQLQKEAGQLASRIRRLGLAVPRLLARHKEEIIERQMILDRLADAGMSMYMTAAVLSRLDTDLEKDPRHTTQIGEEIALGKLYCTLAFQNMDRAMDGFFDNDDDQVEQVSDRITGWK